MGIYRNVVHKSNPINVKINGQKQKVYVVKFLCKIQDILPDTWNTKRANMYRLRLHAMNKSWGEGGPQYVVNISDKPEIGDNVYEVDKSFRGYIDDQPFPGKLLGQLIKENTHWICNNVKTTT